MRKQSLHVQAILVTALSVLAGRSFAYEIRPFTIDLEDGVARILRMVHDTRLPDKPIWPGLGSSAGISLEDLRSLRAQWLGDYSWKADQEFMNSFKHSTTEIEGLTTHFIHEKFPDSHAIPLLLEHGWPGSFLEFAPIIKSLTKGQNVSFHVIIPSLPGFAFSQPAPENWTNDDTARLHHTLMTEVLGYKKFAVHGTDFGTAPAYSLYDGYNQSVRAAHFAFLPFYPLGSKELEDTNITLSSLEVEEARRFDEWNTIGNGYLQEQATKPNTIGLALQDNPIGQLAWIGEKCLAWSDPRASLHSIILRFVSLSYHTETFLSSVYIYYQDPPDHGNFRLEYTKAKTDAPLLFSAFRYNVGFWPAVMVEKVGNLVEYKNHEFEDIFRGWIIRGSWWRIREGLGGGGIGDDEVKVIVAWGWI